MAQEMVPDTYDYTKLFGIWKGKGNKLDLNMTRYIHGKERDAKFLETLVSERMKPFIKKTAQICNHLALMGHRVAIAPVEQFESKLYQKYYQTQ